jgi:hypothetical protein
MTEKEIKQEYNNLVEKYRNKREKSSGEKESIALNFLCNSNDPNKAFEKMNDGGVVVKLKPTDMYPEKYVDRMMKLKPGSFPRRRLDKDAEYWQEYLSKKALKITGYAQSKNAERVERAERGSILTVPPSTSRATAQTPYRRETQSRV